MNLFERDECKVPGADGGSKAAAIFEDVFAGVPIGKAQIEDELVVEIADAAGAGAESVDEPGKFLERLQLQDPQAARADELPRIRHGRRPQGFAGRTAPQR